ncbi:MAG: TIGR02300 family protein [Alphaproteobacteria bacterium]|nr:TIGR02300 family protein [Alphaproteobacteria bacterium]
MAKPEWGVKRACLACGTRFYDLIKQPIVCPTCETVFDPETIFKPRRARAEEAAAAAKAVNDDAAKAKLEAADNAEDELAALVEGVEVDDDDDDDSDLLPNDDDDDDDNVVPIPQKGGVDD